MEQFSISFEKPEIEEPKKDANVDRPQSQPQPQQQAEPKMMTVSEVTGFVKKLIDRNFADVWVVGEVSNFRNPSSKHYYFSLKDEDSQLNAVIFNASKRLSFDLADGLELICHGSITVYPVRGQYQIIIDECYPKGKGALQIRFEQLKKKLDEEGLFAQERKRTLPFLPRKIGVVTSPTGAAVRDVIHVLTRRYPPIEVLLYPAKVQGDGAAQEVAFAIESLNKRSDIDLLIVGRGGGSLEDLWAFNEEVVARAIFSSRIPVISAVGHEIDFTISDFVADVRAPTPSAAAEIAVPVMADLKEQIKQRKRQLFLAMQNRLVHGHNNVKNLTRRIPDPRKMIPDLILRVDSSRERIIYSIGVMLEKYKKELSAYMDNLKHLSPMHILEKGYAVVQKEDGSVVRSYVDVAVNDDVRLVFHEGEAGARITSKSVNRKS